MTQLELSNELLPLCAIILAAGESRRFGLDNKLLAKVEGVPILERVVRAVTGGGVQNVIVVTGADHEVIVTQLSGYNVTCIENGNWREGMGSSLARGAAAVDENLYSGILVCLGDLPYLSSDEVQRVIAVFEEQAGRRIIIPEHEGRRGHPVIFSVSYHSELMELSGDSGAKDILKDGYANLMAVPVDSIGIFKDIDSCTDLEGNV